MSIIDLSHLFSTLYAGLKLGKEPYFFVEKLILCDAGKQMLIVVYLYCRDVYSKLFISTTH